MAMEVGVSIDASLAYGGWWFPAAIEIASPGKGIDDYDFQFQDASGFKLITQF